MAVYKAIYFDLDNTLVHRARSISVYARRLYDRYSTIFVNTNPEALEAVISKQDNGGYLAKGSGYNSIKEAVSHELHKHFIADDRLSVEQLRQHWIENFSNCAVAMEGAYELLSVLAKHNFHIGIISNGAHKTRVMTANQLQNIGKVKQIVSSEAFGIKKPNSEIFTATAGAVGFSADECWYVGDHPINDIFGARQAGMNTIWLKGFHDWPDNLEQPEHSVASLLDVPDIVLA